MDKITWSQIQDANSWDSSYCDYILSPELTLYFRQPAESVEKQVFRDELETKLRTNAALYFRDNREKLMNEIINYKPINHKESEDG